MLPDEMDEETDRLTKVALGLLSERAADRRGALTELAGTGAGVVHPLAYALEIAFWYGVSDKALRGLSDHASDVLAAIGDEALPALDDLVWDPEREVYINEWAQSTIFKVLGIKKAGRRRVCHHPSASRSVDSEGSWRCTMCGTEFDDVQVEALRDLWSRGGVASAPFADGGERRGAQKGARHRGAKDGGGRGMRPRKRGGRG